jgi:hypothetical protein
MSMIIGALVLKQLWQNADHDDHNASHIQYHHYHACYQNNSNIDADIDMD